MTFIHCLKIENCKLKIALGVILVSSFSILVSAPSASAATLSKPPNNLGLVAYYSFEDGNSNTATDFSGRGNTGTLTNMEAADWVDGKIGTALQLDGDNDFVNLGSSSELDLTSSFSISAWVKISNKCNFCKIIAKQKDDNQPYSIMFDDSADQKFVFEIKNSSQVAAQSKSTTVPALDTWYHIVATYNGTTQILYVNGQDEDTDTPSYTLPETDADLLIGARESASSPPAKLFFDGIVDEVRIYNRALSATEVAALYARTGITKARAAAPANGLVGYWSFSEGSGSSTADRSGNGNTGTLTNMENTDWVTGKRGKALDFNNGTSSEYVAVSDANSLDLTDLTISFWFKPNTTFNSGTGRKDLVTKYLSYWIILNFPGNDGKLILTSDNGSTHVRTTQTSWEADTWYHFAATLSGSSATLYVNGARDVTGTVNPPNITTNDLTFGGNPTANTYGSLIMDDIRIYDRALTPHEVKVLYSATAETVRTRINSTPTTGALTTGLVAHHTFDGGYLNTTTSTDATNNGNDGTLTGGPTPTIGKLGQALKFDGLDDYINVADSTTLNTASVTVSAWVKPSTIASTRKPIVQYYYPGSIPSGYLLANYQSAFSFCVNTGTFTGSASCGGYDIKTASSLSVNTWYHLVGSFDGGTKLRSIYLNGVLENSTSTPAGINYTDYPTRLSFEISRDYQGNAGMPGLIDDVRIYNRALSPAEVLQLYNVGR